MRFDLSGFNVRLRGLDAACAEVVDEAWGLFAGAGGVPVLDVHVRFEGAELRPGTIDDAALDRTIAADAISFRSREGRIEIDEKGNGTAVVATGHAATRAYALINLIIPALAWRLPRYDALILHSGAVLIGDRGFLLLGQAGAGKSTFVTHAIAGGARAVSEDLNLLVYENDRCCPVIYGIADVVFINGVRGSDQVICEIQCRIVGHTDISIQIYHQNRYRNYPQRFARQKRNVSNLFKQ